MSWEISSRKEPVIRRPAPGSQQRLTGPVAVPLPGRGEEPFGECSPWAGVPPDLVDRQPGFSPVCLQFVRSEGAVTAAAAAARVPFFRKSRLLVMGIQVQAVRYQRSGNSQMRRVVQP